MGSLTARLGELNAMMKGENERVAKGKPANGGLEAATKERLRKESPQRRAIAVWE